MPGSWDDLAALDINAADWNLDATYLIRMFSVFERAVSSYWRLLSGNANREVKGDVLLDEVGIARTIPDQLIQGAQDVRIQRNNLVHRRIEDHVTAMAFEDARASLQNYLGKLPESWG